MFVAAFARRNRIVTASAPRMAAQYPAGREVTSVKQTVNLQCFNGIGRTAGFKPATGWQ